MAKRCRFTLSRSGIHARPTCQVTFDKFINKIVNWELAWLTDPYQKFKTEVKGL